MSRKKRAHEHPDERWLVSYADMITVLMALFIVLFSISVVNKGKFDELALSLKKSFNGAVVDGGTSILTFGSTNVTDTARKSAATAQTQPIPEQQKSAEAAAQQLVRQQETQEALDRARALEAAQADQLAKAREQIDGTVARLGLSDRVETEINERGLVIRLVTDDVLFDIGSAEMRPAVLPLLGAIAVAIDPIQNPIRIEGHTDAVPFQGDPLGNVELSTERAVSVYRALVDLGLKRETHPDLAPLGFGEMRPLDVPY